MTCPRPISWGRFLPPIRSLKSRNPRGRSPQRPQSSQRRAEVLFSVAAVHSRAPAALSIRRQGRNSPDLFFNPQSALANRQSSPALVAATGPRLCHSEAPVLWGPKNPRSFLGWPGNVPCELRRSFVVPIRSGLLRMTCLRCTPCPRSSNFRVRSLTGMACWHMHRKRCIRHPPWAV